MERVANHAPYSCEIADQPVKVFFKKYRPPAQLKWTLEATKTGAFLQILLPCVGRAAEPVIRLPWMGLDHASIVARRFSSG